MTISFPDLSNHNGALAIQPGTVAVSAKASESTTFTDGQYAHFKSAAAKAGALFYGYHFLHAGNGAAQAKYCHGIVGNTPVMIDCEPVGTSKPTVSDVLAFATELKALGGWPVLVYFPHWYWLQLGSPSLLPLKAAGLSLISSAYTTYSDSGEGWAAYGGMTPVIWQWTDKQPYSGAAVDFNAYKGTTSELASLLGYSTAQAVITTEVTDMPYLISVTPDPSNTQSTGAGIYLVDAGKVEYVPDLETLGALEGKFGQPLVVSPAFYEVLSPENGTVTDPIPGGSIDVTALGAAIGPAVAAALTNVTLTTGFAAKS